MYFAKQNRKLLTFDVVDVIFVDWFSKVLSMLTNLKYSKKSAKKVLLGLFECKNNIWGVSFLELVGLALRASPGSVGLQSSTS